MSGGGGGSQVIGFKYYFDIHMGISRGPVDELCEIRVGDRVAWFGSVKHDDPASTSPDGVMSQWIDINQPSLFGGDKVEGGIDGTAYILFGKPTQTALSIMQSRMGGLVPGFRDRFTIYYTGQISSMNPYPKAWQMRTRRNLMGWDGDVFDPTHARIYLNRVPTPTSDFDVIYAQNPAHMLFEAFTNRAWGRGLPREELDLTSFETAALQLYNEGFGLCHKWSRRDRIESFVQGILDTIAGVVYLDRATGLLKLTLVRGGYDREDMSIVDSSNGLLQITESAVASSWVAVNEVIVKYHDHRTNTTKEVRCQNIAAIQAQNGQIVSQTKDYPSIPTPELALRVAQRDLRAQSVGLRRFNLTFDRSAWRLVPGQAIRIRDLTRNIPDLVVRLGNVEDGTIVDGKIKITAMQDVFALPTSTFNAVEPPAWVPPDNTPCIGEHEVFEASYRQVFRQFAPAEFDYIEPESGYISTLVKEGKPLNASYELGVKIGASTPDEYVPDPTYICPL